jgi:ABC-type transport system involved in multi-copper enzyme maturation permease subunit
MILSNPITVKELRSRMRGIRAILPMMAYLVVLSIFVLTQFARFGSEINYSQLALSGRTLGFSLLYVQIFLVLLLSPAYAASAITIEKERETFETMQSTMLTSWDIVAGKVFSGVSYGVLLVLSSLPLLSLSFWMGGFDFNHLFWGFLIISTSALVVSALGIMLSTIFARSYLATGVTYGVVIVGFGIAYLFQLFLDRWYANYPTSSGGFEWHTAPFWLIFSMNPLEMLRVLDRDDVKVVYQFNNFAHVNPLIDKINEWLNVNHLPYYVIYVFLSLAASIILLFLASHFLFRSSRGDRT